MRRTRRLAACLSAAALSSACVAGGPGSDWCVDWNGDGVNDCDPPPTPPGPPPPPDRSPCEQLGDQLGTPLVDAPRPYGAWIETSDAGDTDGGWSPISRPLMYWSHFFPAGWIWSGGTPGGTAPAALLSSVTDEGGVDHLTVEASLPNVGWRWIQTDTQVTGMVGEQEMISITQSDGSAILYWLNTSPSVTDSVYLELDGDVKARGWAVSSSIYAGPSSSNLKHTWDGTKGFVPAQGVCLSPTDEGADETGADEPAPVEDVEPFDPCAEIPSPFPLKPYVPLGAYSPAWRDGEPTAHAWLPPFEWLDEPSIGDPATLETPDGTNEIFLSQPGGFSPHAYIWIELGPETVPEDPDSGVVVLDITTHEVVSLGVEMIELLDGGAILYIANSPPEGAEWSIVGLNRPVRGWVRGGEHIIAGITDQFVLTQTQLPDGTWTSFMPAAGWCDVVVQGFGPLAPDDTGGSSSDGGAVLDGTSG